MQAPLECLDSCLVTRAVFAWLLDQWEDHSASGTSGRSQLIVYSKNKSTSVNLSVSRAETSPGVGAAGAVIGLPGGLGQGLLDEAQVKVEEEGTVEEEEPAVTALGVAGELETA